MKHYHEIYRAKQLPIFQNRIFHSEQLARNCIKGDVVLVQDLETGLIFNQAFKPDLMQYDADYQNEQAVSDTFQRHLENVSEIIQRHFQGQTLIEVGCGKGHFLEQLQGLGFKITGLDPIYEGSNPSIIKKCFSPEIGLRAEGIILRHVLEHVQDPVEFISRIRDSNGGSGKIYIEVPCFEWILDHRAWFDIFYEHVNYFRLSDFHNMFGKVYEIGHLFNGQYLYVVADLATLQKPMLNQRNNLTFPSNFLSEIDHVATIAKGKRNAVWGGASKGVIFTLYMQRAGVNVDLVIDINPAKQNKFMACSGLIIKSPTEGIKTLKAGDDIFIMNSNYLQEIVELSNNRFNYIQVDHHAL